MAKNPEISQPIAPAKPAAAPPKRERVINFDLLSEEDREAIRAEAKDKFDQMERARTEDAFLKEEMKCLEREAHPEIEEEKERVDMSGLAAYAAAGGGPGRPAAGVIIDGKLYPADRVLDDVPRSVAQVLRDTMARTQRHEAEIHSNPEDQAMRANRAISKAGPGFASVNASTLATTRF